MFLAALGNMHVPEFRPLDGVKIATTEAEANEQGGTSSVGGGQLEDVDTQCERMLGGLPKPSEMKDFR